jgi:hypothetical protein
VLADAGIAPPLEPYTELALAQPAVAPQVRDGAVALPFWIHNAEGATRAYAWTATTRDPGGDPVTAASGRLTLGDGAERTVRARIPVTCAGSRVRVEVSIGGPHRTVGVWVPCDGTTP